MGYNEIVGKVLGVYQGAIRRHKEGWSKIAVIDLLKIVHPYGVPTTLE